MATVDVTFRYHDQDVTLPLKEEPLETVQESVARKQAIASLRAHIMHTIRPITAIWLDLKTDLIFDTIQTKIPKAKASEEKRIWEAYLLTAQLVCIVGLAIFALVAMPFSLEGQIVAVTCAMLANLISYLWCNEYFVFPERRLYGGDAPGPWFCPNIETLMGKIALLTGVWPLIMGMILPIPEAYTRVERWEGVLKKQKEQLVQNVAMLVEFYKQHGQTTLDQLQTAALDPVKAEDYQRMIQCFQEMADFLRKFDSKVPDLNTSHP